MKKSIFLLFTALIVASCSSVDKRTPASLEERQDMSHQKFQGQFDKPDQ